MEKKDKVITENLVEGKKGGALQKRALMTALTNKLKIVPSGQSQSAEELIAEMVVDVALTGEVQLLPSKPEAKAPVMIFSPRDWYECIKWIFDRVEGKPVQAVDASIRSSIFFDGYDTMLMEDDSDRSSEMDGDDKLLSETERMPEGTKK
jgi:hypothetical protein